MKFSKKITALFIAVMMVVSAIPFTASAASEPYLTFTGTDSFSIKTNNSKRNWNGTLEYSTDTNTWTTWDGTQISSDNNVLYLRGTGNTQITGSSDNSSKYWVITTPGTVACSGDIRTLLDYTDPEGSEMGTKCFYYLFYNCTSLTAAPELPATILAERCYSYMFYGCTSLTTAPELWATTLERYCYSCMFYGCESLTTAPELWATTLTEECYSCMFYGCTSLTTAPQLPATELANYCYNNMFGGCTSLTTPSELPATTLTKGCYNSMFQGCTGIKLSTEQTAEYSVPYSIPKEGTGTEGSNSLNNMFTGTGGTFTGSPSINTTYYIPAPASTEPEPEPATPSYGNYVVADGDNGADLYDKEVYFNDMAWYVIEDNSTDTNAGSLTLLAKGAIGSSQFYTSKSSASDMSYNGSTVKAYLDGLTAEGGAFEDVADAILPTTLTTYGYDSTDVYETTENAKLYLLSVSEASELPMRVKMLGGTAGKYWWLRSPGYYNDDGARVAYEVNYDVQASGENPTTSYYVRPALNLDLSKVEFDSSSREFSILAEEEEASTVSFTKATSANDITAENIGTCTFAEAKAWILDNWVSVTNTQQYFVDVVYFDENGVFSVFFITPASMSKLGFNNDCNEADTSYTVDGIRGDVSSYGDDAWLCTPAAPAEPNNGASITVAETISENFYLDDEFYGEDSFVTVNYNHNSNVSETDDFRTDVVAMNSLPELDDSTSEYNGARKFSVVQAPAQITEEVTITVYASQADAQAGTNAIDTITTSTYDYCRAIIEGDYAANLKALAKSTLDYAAAAQLFFNYNTDEMATKDNANNAFYGEVAGADLSNVAGPGALATGIEQVSVVVKSDLEINLLSRNKINVTGYNLDTTNGSERFKATSVEEKNGDFYVIHIEGIEPDNMDNTITVNIDCGDIVMTANFVMKAMAGSSDEKMVTLAKAMYLYGAAANAYFG